jgi:hypothetical protein
VKERAMRAKFRVEALEPYVNVWLSPVGDGVFVTPGKRVRLEAVSQEAAKGIEVGKEYYMELTPVEPGDGQ